MRPWCGLGTRPVRMETEQMSPKLDFVRFWSGPYPEEAVGCDVAERLIEGQDTASHIVDVFPFSPV